MRKTTVSADDSHSPAFSIDRYGIKNKFNILMMKNGSFFNQCKHGVWLKDVYFLECNFKNVFY